MKNYKQKYEQAMLRMNKWVEGSEIIDPKEVAEFVFPELRESEDERIRKEDEEVRQYIVRIMKQRDINVPMVQKALAWLEKQGEKKPFDYENANIQQKDFAPKGKPKFKVGDWITNGIDFTFQVISIEDNHYLRSDDYFIDIETADKKFRLWTIQDAKDGDVLALNGEVFIYAHRKRLFSIAIAHCFVDSAGGFYFEGEFGYTGKGNSIHPATKEQRNLLFQKMKEAGYEWDAEKKELKKIEQNSSWSEEDEKTIDEAISLINMLASGYGEKVTEPITFNGVNMINNIKERLRNLHQKPNHWKPSDEQMQVLEVLVETSFGLRHSKVLESLYNDLKKLG